ncbi:MAG: cytochrome-c oxidase, partial [Methyloligellaceae bacterium]
MMLAITYAGRMAFEDWRPVPQPWLMWQNTIVLMLGGAAMQLAHSAAQRGQWSNVKIGLLAGGVLTVAFLIGQM